MIRLSAVEALGLILVISSAVPAGAARIELLRQAPDPYGYPRPADGQRHVPVRTSFYFELKPPSPDDPVLTSSVQLVLAETGSSAGTTPSLRHILREGGRFEPGGRGEFLVRHNWRARTSPLLVSIEPGEPLRPATTYRASVSARTAGGKVLRPADATWTFTTESVTTAPVRHSFTLDLTTEPVRWKGGFFTGFCKPGFATTLAYGRGPSNDLMQEARRRAPRAWSLQRDWHPTGTELGPVFLPQYMPNVVRELETRRITALEETSGGVALRVEDFFGHEQYGIPSGRPVGDDYAPGQEVLVADSDRSSTATVVSVDSATSTVVVAGLSVPASDFRTSYTAPLPEREDPNAPGLFPRGGCYLLRSRPAGTPRYFWKRFDQEYDLTIGTLGRRQVVSFCEAPGDLSRDGRPGNTAKDYVLHHEVIRTMTARLIERYGERCLDFVWSVLNEPDLSGLFFRAGADEVERFYDYTVDAVLRAFEDAGLDSDRVFIGGLELGIAPFSSPLGERFLAHCSPTSTHPLALARNAAYADPRLDGRRSRRTERLAGAHRGKGTPCDFISIHSYHGARKTARRLIGAKETALRIDPHYYRDLWVNSHESCPDWAIPADPAASDSYLGNGYFSTWCADVVRRQLAAAAADPRYAMGETILTFWSWPASNLKGAVDCVHRIDVDEDGDGNRDRSVTVPLPVFHLLEFLAGMEGEYWPLEVRTSGEEESGGPVVSGFGSRTTDTMRLILYTHSEVDPQSRGAARTEARVTVRGLPPGDVEVSEKHLGGEEGAFFREVKRLQRPEGEVRAVFTAEEAARLEKASRLGEGHTRVQTVSPSGDLELSARLPVNGVVLIELRERK